MKTSRVRIPKTMAINARGAPKGYPSESDSRIRMVETTNAALRKTSS